LDMRCAAVSGTSPMAGVTGQCLTWWCWQDASNLSKQDVVSPSSMFNLLASSAILFGRGYEKSYPVQVPCMQ
jgi:hypothetical protein